MNTSAVSERYLKHDKAVRDLCNGLKKAEVRIQFPIANEVLTDLSNRIDTIFKSILSLASSDDLYTLFILYRSMLEHSYKAFYIFAKTTKDRSDDTAEKYQKHFFISEFLAEQAGVLEMEDLVNENENKTNFLQFLIRKLPELQGFDKDNQKEISAAIKQFKLSEIIKYLHEDFSKKDENKNVAAVFAKTLPEYSFVSTFTHGGAYASKLMEKFCDQNSFQEQIDRIVKISFTVCGVMKENVFITYQLDNSFLEILKTFQDMRKP